MQCGILRWILKENKNIRQKSGEILIKSVVQLAVFTKTNFLIFFKEACLCKILALAEAKGHKETLCMVFATVQ